MGREKLRKRPSAHARSLRLLRCKQRIANHIFETETAEASVGLTHLLCCQATYDPSHGYSPQPIDISGMALSRELQVNVFLTLTEKRLLLCEYSIDMLRFGMQSMAEQLAENYHNTWGRKKKLELQAKGKRVC